MGDKIHSQKGKSPDYKLRFVNIMKCNEIRKLRPLEGGVGSDHPLKKA